MTSTNLAIHMISFQEHPEAVRFVDEMRDLVNELRAGTAIPEPRVTTAASITAFKHAMAETTDLLMRNSNMAWSLSMV